MNIFWKFLPFWIFLAFFRFGAVMHYSLISPLGEKFLPLWLVGILMGSGSVIQLLLDVPAGHILDRYGYKRFLIVAAAIFSLAAVCFMFGLTQTTYLISIFIATFGWLFFGPGVNAYVLSHAPRHEAGKFISFRDVFSSVGVVLSSAVLPFVLILSPERMGYVLFAILFVALVLIILSPRDTESVHKEIKISTHHHYIKRHQPLSSLRAIKRLNPASGLLLLLNLSGSVFYGIVWFVVPLVIVHEANSGLLSLGLGIFDFAVVVMGFFLGNLADRMNRRTMVLIGLLVFSFSGMLVGWSFSWMFLIFGFLATSGDEAAGLSLWAWLHSLDREHDSDGAISGVINLFQDFGWAIGPMIAGVAYGAVGPSWTILIGAVPIFIMWIVCQFAMKDHASHSVVLVDTPRKPHKARHRS
ncbi:MAG: MFS transporter [Candidatus Paceibacterota bacterium]|jgi:MFS family permease